MPERIWALVIKELLALLKDPQSRVIVFVPPIIQTLVFGYAASFDLNDVPYAIYDQDQSGASRDLGALFQGSPNFREVAAIQRDAEIVPLVDSSRALIVVNIDRGFEASLLQERPTSVQVIADGRNSNTALLATNYVRSIVETFNQQWAREHTGTDPSPGVVVRAWFNPNLESRWFIVPGLIGVLVFLVTTMVTAFSVAREREQGTFDQLLVTPMRPFEILLGKSLPGVIIGFIEATVMIGIVTLWFQVPLRGNLVTLYVGIGFFLISVIGIGLAISSLSATMQQALLGAFLILVPAVLLSGFATPIANMPLWLQTLTYANPLRYFTYVVRAVFLEGASLRLLWPQLWPMAAIGLPTLALASWLFRRRLQ